MPETYENWLGGGNIYVFTMPPNPPLTPEIYLALSCSVDFKAPGKLCNEPSKTKHLKCSLKSNVRPEKKS